MDALPLGLLMRPPGGIGKVIRPSDLATDMQTIMDFYRNIHPKYPENFALDQEFAG